MRQSREPSESVSTFTVPSEDTQSRTASTASKRFVSAPFLLQGQLARRVPVGEPLVVDTPPSYRTNPNIQTLSPPLQLRPVPGMQLTPAVGGNGGGLQTRPPLHTCTTTSPTNDDVPSRVGMPRFVREASESSTALTSNYACTPLTEASMPYTWTDSYLEESPEATRARWLSRQTFGPVLQSEGGASSTVASTPRGARQEGEAIWGAVLERNAQEREGSRGGGVYPERANVGGAGGPPARRFNLEAAERGGDGLGRPPQQQQTCVVETAASPTAKALFPGAANAPAHHAAAETMHRGAPQHLISDVSTVVATVQQPRRGAQIAPVEKPQAAQSTQAHPSPSTVTDMSSDSNNNNNNRISCPSIAMLSSTIPMNAPEVRASRGALSIRSPGTAARDSSARSSARHGSSRTSSSNDDDSSSDLAETSTSNLMKAGGGRASRSGPLRRRVLKPLYDD